MNRIQDRLIEIARRKERLIARAEAQRAAIGASFRQLERPISVIDRGLEIARFFRGRPLLVAAVVTAVVVFRRRGLLSLVGRALTVWRLWRSVSAWTARWSPRLPSIPGGAGDAGRDADALAWWRDRRRNRPPPDPAIQG